jgi:Na+-translocating ferredoxin:NAD+ oxidoreductase RNF subunit RnfB
MNSLIISIITMGVLGAFFAYGLSIALKKFRVEEDHRFDQVESVLPGINCGGCGLPGCRSFAEAVVNGEIEPDGCTVGGYETAREIAEILEIKIEESERQVAVLMCRGTEEAAKRKADYLGIKTCYAAGLLQRGDKFCSFGCLGYGDCVEVCKFAALRIGDGGIPVVNRENCTACGLCVKTCPKNLFELHPVARTFFVFCKSLDDPRSSRLFCTNACTGCQICTKGVKSEEIVVVNNLSIINDPKVIQDEEARQWVEKCPTGAIGLLEIENKPSD